VLDAGLIEAGKAQPAARFEHAAREEPAEPVVPAGQACAITLLLVVGTTKPEVKAVGLAITRALPAPVMPVPEGSVPENKPARPGQYVLAVVHAVTTVEMVNGVATVPGASA